MEKKSVVLFLLITLLSPALKAYQCCLCHCAYLQGQYHCVWTGISSVDGCLLWYEFGEWYCIDISNCDIDEDVEE